MALVRNFPFLTIILSMITGVFCAVLKPRIARAVTLILLGVIAVMSFMVLADVVAAGGSYVYWMGHFPAPFGNEIRIGVLEALMACMFSVVMILSLMGGLRHIFSDVDEQKVNFYFMMACLLFSSMLALIYTNDLFTAYVFVEINTLASCAVVMLKHSKEALVATTRYLIMSLLGSGMFLIGICILYGITGHLLMSPLQESVKQIFLSGSYMFPLRVVIILFSVSMAIKSALFPFHTWLPDAHGFCTTASSSILSGLVLKSYIILLIKIFYRVIGIEVFRASGMQNFLFVLGMLAMVFGSINALHEKDIKRMVAYSSVAQMGYIFLGIGIGTEAGMAAACFQIIAHAITKPLLFTASGKFKEINGGTSKIEDLRGAARVSPLAGVAFAVGTLSMIGLPFTAGFIAKMNLALASLGTAKTVAALIVISISTVLNALYYVPTLIKLFDTPVKGKEFKTEPNDFPFTAAVVVFIALNFLLGGGSVVVVRLLEQGLNMLG